MPSVSSRETWMTILCSFGVFCDEAVCMPTRNAGMTRATMAMAARIPLNIVLSLEKLGAKLEVGCLIYKPQVEIGPR